MNNHRRVIQISTLEDQGQEPELAKLSPAERIAMVWQLTIDAWAFKGEHIAESRLPRHIIHIRR